ncbi:uncharacterized protein PAC_10033 [Phialocephala subalpina]|uniref:F-box domain-containing protein n=1 Tax=Phialocephala subalpina TaxID=576137 RepID=A0A1L7X571_9HELO|nr:uncharacterized protein PAC_10033 [Phialocephala subalpina]
MESVLPSRPPAFINGLTRLPRELVHRVLDDLPMIKILQIISHKIPYLDECIRSHMSYRRVFPSQREIDRISDHFILHRDICRWKSISLTQGHVFMTSNPSSSRQLYIYGYMSSSQLACTREFMSDEIRKHVTLQDAEVEALAAFASQPLPTLYSSLQELEIWRARWEWIRGAKIKFNKAKAAQWFKAAELIESHPGKLMLKKPLDPSQGPPRPNTAHIAAYLRRTANKILKHRQFGPYGDTCRHKINGLVLVPYDRFLWTFLDGVKKCPPETFKYPKDIAANLESVLASLTNVDTRPTGIVNRIDWGPKKPVFLVKKHSEPGLHLCPLKSLSSNDPRELEWLAAFLKVVTWMEGNVEAKSEVDGLDGAALELKTLKLEV